MTPWDWVVVVATCVWFAWIFTTLIIRFYPDLAAAQGLWLWLKWPALACAAVISVQQFLIGEDVAINVPVLFGAWWYFKDSGDDDYRRRLKRKAAEKVQAMAGRLVVVPVSA